MKKAYLLTKKLSQYDSESIGYARTETPQQARSIAQQEYHTDIEYVEIKATRCAALDDYDFFYINLADMNSTTEQYLYDRGLVHYDPDLGINHYMAEPSND